MSRRHLLLTALAAAALGGGGCATLPAELNNADRLLRHPQFSAAARVAPDFVSDALKTINRLEHELERQ